MKKMSKKIFWTRLIFYTLLGGILPFAFLIWRFKLFSKVSTLSIGGWGLVGIIFLLVFFLKLIKAVRKGLPFSIGAQFLEGLCKLILPLIVIALCVYYMQDVMKELFEFLVVLIFCETGAILLNPIPQWAHENQKEEQNDSIKFFIETLGLSKEKK